MSDTNKNTITIDGVAYDRANLSQEVLDHVTNVQLTERKIQEAEQHVSMLKTARTAYANALKAALPTN